MFYTPRILLQNILLLITLVVIACQDDGWHKTDSGLLYKVYHADTTDSVAKLGRTIKLHYTQHVRDSMVGSDYSLLPYYEAVIPGYGNPYKFSVVFPGLKKGDSVIVKQRVDLMLSNRLLKSIPENIHGDDEWITTIKVLDVFLSDSLLQLDKKLETEKFNVLQLQRSEDRINDFFRQKNIRAAELDKGIFIQPLVSGGGIKPEDGKIISVKCKVSTLEGKLVNNSMDATSNNADTLLFKLGTGFLPPHVEKTILYFNEGSHVKIYIAGTHIFGTTPPENINLSDDLVYDILILDVE